jgi:thiamine biosynthesis lipoprotein
VLKAAGIRHALVNSGGSTIGAIGAPPGFDGWPVDLGASVSGRRTMLLCDGAISTSQQRLRHLPFGPGHFGDIIDPDGKAPIESESIVSVVTAGATSADALSTTLLLMPPSEGKKLLAEFSPASALWISSEGDLQDIYLPLRLRLTDVR